MMSASWGYHLRRNRKEEEKNQVSESRRADDEFSQDHVEFEVPMGNTHRSDLNSEAKWQC